MKNVGFEVITEMPEDYGLLGCNALWFGGSPAFRKNISTPPSESKSKLSTKAAETGLMEQACMCTRAVLPG
jgi:hypothetical protein